jgi:hypothetical protein
MAEEGPEVERVGDVKRSPDGLEPAARSILLTRGFGSSRSSYWWLVDWVVRFADHTGVYSTDELRLIESATRSDSNK